MAQRVSAREIELNEQARRTREGTLGLVQCDGCPAGEPLVSVNKPGHRDDCELCQRHCRCFRVPDGVDFPDEWS